MKAMLLAAGLGTRLKPLTDHRPKALVEVGGMTLLERAVRLLQRHGVEEAVVNVHHFAGQIEAFLEEKGYFGMRIAISDERSKLLDTGGGLKKAAWFFDDGAPFLVYNTDILTDLDLGALYRAHLDSGCLASLAVRRRPANRCFLFDKQKKLAGWRNRKTGQTRWCGEAVEPVEELAFSGIQILDPAIFRYFPEEEAFSLVELYLRAGAYAPLCAYPHDDSAWIDAGKLEDLEEAERMF
ncbi:MAG: nucleotidyltransferase family protein [Saprospiraceae bacterium]